MDKKKILLEDIDKVNPFKTPEGYFENFSAGIMSQLPDVAQKNSTNIGLWQRVRPWVYMAAMFAGIALMIRLFTGSPTQAGIKHYASEGLNLTSSSDIDDYYHYYDDGLAQLAYDDAFYDNSDSE
jgi:hypothetical protein